ncbi:MAG: hypothetical protein ACRD5H_18640, partial [Nitrososphaerales archaeon]
MRFLQTLLSVCPIAVVCGGCATFPTHSYFEASRYSIITECYEGPPLEFVIDEDSRNSNFFKLSSGVATNWRLNRFAIGKAFDQYLFQAAALLGNDLEKKLTIVKSKLVQVTLRYSFSQDQMARLLAKDTLQAISFIDTVSLLFYETNWEPSIDWVDLTIIVETTYPVSPEPKRDKLHREVKHYL